MSVQRHLSASDRRSWTPAVRRAADELERREFEVEFYDVIAHAALTAALDDPDLGPQVSLWRSPCGHSRVLNPMEQRLEGAEAEYEQACSPCLRDRMRAYFLGGAS